MIQAGSDGLKLKNPSRGPGALDSMFIIRNKGPEESCLCLMGYGTSLVKLCRGSL